MIGFVPSAFAAMVVSLIAVRAIAIITKESDEPSDLSFAIGVGIGCMAFLALIGFSIYLGFVLMNAETGDTDDDNGM